MTPIEKVPRIVIRADGSESVGMGHVMRTLAIAEALQTLGAIVLYVCADEMAKVTIESKGFKVVALGTDPADLEDELHRLSALLKSVNARFVFVDSFCATNSYFEAIQAMCPVGSFAFGRKFSRSLDLVVSYLPSADKGWLEDSFGGDGTTLLLGERYVPIRREFRNVRRRDLANRIESVLIMAGGSDRLGMCARVLARLRRDPFWATVEKRVVLGQASSNRDGVLSLAEADASVCVYESVRDMAPLMSKCDMAITACGYSVYELALCGVPMVAFATSADQAENGFVPGIMDFVGDVECDLDAGTGRVCESARSLALSSSNRAAMRDAASALGLDGRGAERIAERILNVSEGELDG